MGCAACEELLMAYLDGELSDAERAAVDGHLAGCEHCRQVLDELASLAGVLRNVYGARAISEDSKARTSSAISAADRRTGADDAARAHLRIGGFEILSRLGEGGMGSVYKARQVTMDRIVALKILRPDLARDAEFVKRFSREARASAKLNHPNIMQGIDVGQDGEHHYFAMEYLEGLTVSRIVRKEGPMDQKRALRVVKQVACGLEHAWKHGIIHRDIKPENIMITARSEVKLCDLGLAKRTDPDASITHDRGDTPLRLARAGPRRHSPRHPL